MSGFDKLQTEALEALAQATQSVAYSIFPSDSSGGYDANGGRIQSLTEAVMGMTAGLCKIAEAIDRLATAVENQDQP